VIDQTVGIKAIFLQIQIFMIDKDRVRTKKNVQVHIIEVTQPRDSKQIAQDRHRLDLILRPGPKRKERKSQSPKHSKTRSEHPGVRHLSEPQDLHHRKIEIIIKRIKTEKGRKKEIAPIHEKGIHSEPPYPMNRIKGEEKVEQIRNCHYILPLIASKTNKNNKMI